jgi:hypothetical protein
MLAHIDSPLVVFLFALVAQGLSIVAGDLIHKHTVSSRANAKISQPSRRQH